MRAGLPRELALEILGFNTLRIEAQVLGSDVGSGSRIRAAERGRGPWASFTPQGWGTIQ